MRCILEGGYLRGADAQEECLCRQMPLLQSQLQRMQYSEGQPLQPTDTIFTTTPLCRNSAFVLVPPTLVNILSSAMPDLRSTPLIAGSVEWWRTVRLRIRSVLHAAVDEGVAHVVLGAFGCGAFQNPATQVAHCFCDELLSLPFYGAFMTTPSFCRGRLEAH